MIQPPSCVYKSHSSTLDWFLLRPDPIKGSKLDMAKHVLSPFLFFSRNSEKAKVKKGSVCIYVHIRVCYLFLKNIITSLAKVAFSYVSLLNTKEIFSGAQRIFFNAACSWLYLYFLSSNWKRNKDLRHRYIFKRICSLLTLFEWVNLLTVCP